MKRIEVDKNKLSPMMIQYINIKDRYEDVILFFRLGDFYEMFFEDAEVAAHELELTLTSKSAGLEERIPMCGVPHHAANAYIERLVDKGYKVGICEQLSDPKTTKGVVKRDVVQIVSKGTIMNNESLNEKDNNYIGNIYEYNDKYIICYTDISTGEFNITKLDNNNLKLINKIINLSLKEVVVNDNINKEVLDVLKKQYNITISYNNDILDYPEYNYLYQDISDIQFINSIKHLLTYLTNTQKRSLLNISNINIINNEEFLKMDIYAKRNLELIENNRLKNRQYSLLWLLDQTKTAMGGRLLKRWIENPLTNIKVINQRLDMVGTLLKEFIALDEIRNILYEIYDLERLSGRIAFGNANGRDLIQLKNSIKKLPDLQHLLMKIKFYKPIELLDDLYQILEDSIYETPPLGLKEGYLIKEGYSKELDEIKEARSGGKDYIMRLENQEREKTGIKNLKVGFNRIFGYYIEVSKGNINLITSEMGYERKQTLANCERYITPELKEKESLILGAEERIINLEYNLFIEIRDKVKTYISKLQDISKVISEIDVLSSFAVVSERYNYVCPKITTEHEIKVLDARHPVVETVNKVEYVPNDIIMNKDNNIILITGPNMAGKSTYMRMIGVIAIMAQIGMYVPAKEATIPIFDAIYTRIGASDDLVSGESTFMVEMIEANNALMNATKNSLILFDELGRGTATFDGMSLAQAILEYIHDNIGCKTIFSTHYHELTDLENTLSNLKNKHVAALEENGYITFLHKVKDGSVDKSYGIHVAKLAKLPINLINRANQILTIYEAKEQERDVIVQTTLPLEIVTEKPSIVEEKLKNIDPMNITPLEALKILDQLKNDIK